MNHDPKDIIEKADELGYRYFTDTVLDLRYSDWIDELRGPVKIAGITFQPSRILQELDPTAYRCGFNNYLDAEELDEVGNFYMYRAEIDACTEALDEENTDE